MVYRWFSARKRNSIAKALELRLSCANLLMYPVDVQLLNQCLHVDVMKWKHLPRYWPFVREISPVNSPHKGQWRGALLFYLISASINRRVNKREVGDLRRHRAHYDVIVMLSLGQIAGDNYRNICIFLHQSVSFVIDIQEWNRLSVLFRKPRQF